MANTSPLKAIQNGLRKHNIAPSANDIRQAATSLGVDIDSQDCVDFLIQHFVNISKSSKDIILTEKSESDFSNESLDSNENIDHGILASLPREEITQSGKEEMVTRIANDLNVTLSSDAIINIASQFDAGLKNTREQRQALEAAIIAYLEYHLAEEQKEQNQSILRMTSTFKDGVFALNREQNDFSNNINKALEVSQAANKSLHEALLERFTISSSKNKI